MDSHVFLIDSLIARNKLVFGDVAVHRNGSSKHSKVTNGNLVGSSIDVSNLSVGAEPITMNVPCWSVRGLRNP